MTAARTGDIWVYPILGILAKSPSTRPIPIWPWLQCWGTFGRRTKIVDCIERKMVEKVGSAFCIWTTRPVRTMSFGATLIQTLFTHRCGKIIPEFVVPTVQCIAVQTVGRRGRNVKTVFHRGIRSVESAWRYRIRTQIKSTHWSTTASFPKVPRRRSIKVLTAVKAGIELTRKICNSFRESAGTLPTSTSIRKTTKRFLHWVFVSRTVSTVARHLN